MPETEFVSMPVMHCLPAIVVEPYDYLLAPNPGTTFISVGASPDPHRPGRGLVFFGIQDKSGRMMTAIVSEDHMPRLCEMLANAAQQMETGQFETPEAGRG